MNTQDYINDQMPTPRATAESIRRQAASIQRCFAVPGDTVIDHIHPVTGRSICYGETLEQIRLRYPGAVEMDLDEFLTAKAAKQDGEEKTWTEITEDRYDEMLNVLPPAAMARGAFLVGEPWDHHATNGMPRFSCFKADGGKFFSLSGHITLAQFREMFGPCSNDYVE